MTAISRRDAVALRCMNLGASQVAPAGGVMPDVLAFLGRTQKTQELAGAPTDLPVGYQRVVWNTTTKRPSCWMNRAGVVFDALDPNDPNYPAG